MLITFEIIGNRVIRLLYFIILSQINAAIAFEDNVLEANVEDAPQLEVRAVFINCEPDVGSSLIPLLKKMWERESIKYLKAVVTAGSVLNVFPCKKLSKLRSNSKLAVTHLPVLPEPEPNRLPSVGPESMDGTLASDSEATRFEREELFKHSVLRDCNKKLALTVKIISEPDSSGDEYLPIEHVFEGTSSSKRRIRLLDPYILRLRREPPLQAYKLRRLDTISGILMDSEGRTFGEGHKHMRSQIRIERDIEHSEEENSTPNNKVLQLQSYATTIHGIQFLESTTYSSKKSALLGPCVKKHNNNMCASSYNTTLNKRSKRSEHNIIVEEATDDTKQWNTKDQFYRVSDTDKESDIHSDHDEERTITDDEHHRSANDDHKIEVPRKDDTKSQSSTDERSYSKKLFRKLRLPNIKENTPNPAKSRLSEQSKANPASQRTKVIRDRSTLAQYDDKSVEESDTYMDAESEERERDYAVYEIGVPELWYKVHVQLFEKLSTADGKTVWNDLTKGEPASVSSWAPEWIGQDLNVRYRPAEWIPREEFSLPTSRLCLLAPIRGGKSAVYADNSTSYSGVSEDGRYIVIPEEDIMGLKDDDNPMHKRNKNDSESDYGKKMDEQNELRHRRVFVRTSRELLSGMSDDKVNVAYQGASKYLTLPHRRPHHAQIDLEARADENELVRVGLAGRIAIAVADSTRRTRTIITLQVGNTGLAAARFRVTTRDCGPALTKLLTDKSKGVTMAGPVLVPPRHTRSMRLELPLELPVDVAHCSVTLLNDEDKSIAVRDVTVKKGDRCFCVWHCECVCLADDPKLICHEMADSRQSAAGLSFRDRTRHARSCCYQDVITINACVVFLGAIIALLLLGFCKALLGLLFNCIGSWGMDLLVQMPRKIDHYYESSIRCREVVYDCEGYAIHPDTRERTVRSISRSMEFFLNTIFFLSLPCILAYDIVKQLIARFRPSKCKADCMSTKVNTNKCYSSQDMQGLALRWRRRRGSLRRWMTPEAQELSKELWKEGLTPIKCEFMRPLLRDGLNEDPHNDQQEQELDSCVDSEQDDTDYVLTQMQKSRESLSILKQKPKS